MIKQILIIGPSWVGDMVMAQALFRLLKQQEPDCVIDVLAPAWTIALLNHMPEVRNAIDMPIPHGKLQLKTRYQIARKLAKTKYDHAIVLPNSFKSALIPWLAGIPKRTGWLGECRYGLLNDTRKLNKTRYPLMVERYIALGLPPDSALPKPLPLPYFSVSADAKQQALSQYHPKWQGQAILVLAPGGAFGPAKRWPAAHFAEVANQQIAKGFDCLIIGGEADKPIANEIMHLTNHRCHDVTGSVPLDATIDLFASIHGLITNDSGLMHLAAALAKPTIALYGPTTPSFTPPLSDHATILKLDLPCQPCFQRSCPLKHHRCMQELHPSLVLATLKQWEKNT